MSILNKFIKSRKQNNVINNSNQNMDTLSIIDTNNYMLEDIKKENIDTKYSLTLTQMKELGPISASSANMIQQIVQNRNIPKEKMYKITNLGKNDKLKAMKNGETFWGSILRKDKTSTMAQLKEVNSGITLDPTMLMMAVALSGIEHELGEIKELNRKIYSFLQNDKQSEIQSDLEILNRALNDFKYNFEDEKYLTNSHKQVMDIKRTANKNMLFYKKQITDKIKKENIINISSTMNFMLKDIETDFKYYRLSLYIYSFSTLMEILLLENYNELYLTTKKEELDNLDNEYKEIFNTTLNYIKLNTNKSLESNVLSGLGSAGKVLGNIAEKVKTKKTSEWLNKTGNNLQKTSQEIKDNYIIQFEKIKNNNSQKFISQIENIKFIYNNTKEIYFDKENIYLDIVK